jgi:hypothetical protein
MDAIYILLAATERNLHPDGSQLNEICIRLAAD